MQPKTLICVFDPEDDVYISATLLKGLSTCLIVILFADQSAEKTGLFLCMN